MSAVKILVCILFFPLLFTGTKVTVVNLQQLQSYAANNHTDTLYVVNFWATWCDPCVKELPAFLEESKKYSGQKVKMIFVSMNAARELGKVQNFVDSHNLGPLVLLLNAGNPNDWIDKIDSSWSGTIPATAMYKSGKKVYFREGEFTSESLDKIIQSKK